MKCVVINCIANVMYTTQLLFAYHQYYLVANFIVHLTFLKLSVSIYSSVLCECVQLFCINYSYEKLIIGTSCASFPKASKVCML